MKQPLPLYEIRLQKRKHKVETMALIHSDIADGTLTEFIHPDDMEQLCRYYDRANRY